MTPEKKWVFKTTQNTAIIAKALIGQMVKSGVKTLGFIGLNDAYGADWLNVVSKMAKEHNIKIVATARYQLSDSSVTAQALKVLRANPDDVFVADTGPDAVLSQTPFVLHGSMDPFYTTPHPAFPSL